MTGTFWNGKPCKARKVKVVVANHGRFREPWFAKHVGEVREAVEVIAPSTEESEHVWKGEPFYIDNEGGPYDLEPGFGWRKVTKGRGHPRWPHLSLDVERVIE